MGWSHTRPQRLLKYATKVLYDMQGVTERQDK